MENKILEILEDVCGSDEVREDININMFDSGLMDSLGVIQLLVEIEDKLGIKIEPTEVERDLIDTPAKVISFIINHK